MRNDRKKPAVHAEKFLTFQLAGEEYGVGILEAREIVGRQEITRVPKTPPFIRGVFNLRGQVIPVIDLRLKFGMSEAQETNETCIIVVEVERTLLGILVDSVSEVLDLTDDQIEPPPEFGALVDTKFILGMGLAKDKIVILLNIGMVLSCEELAAAVNATI